MQGIPFWSADSRFVAFGAQGKLMRMDVSGGPPLTVCTAPLFSGGTWNGNGTIVFAAGLSRSSGLYQVQQSGGPATRIATPGAATLPEFLPDGIHFIYREYNGFYLTTLDGKQRKRAVDASYDLMSARYAPPSAGGALGHLLFVRNNTLMAQPMDPKTFDLTGEAFPLGTEQVGAFSVSPNGTLAYLAGLAQSVARPVWYDRKGTELGTLGPPGRYSSLALSHDGKRVAVDRIVSGSRDIWLVDAATGVPSKFTFGPGAAYAPVWSPEDKRLAFSYNPLSASNIDWKDSSGVGNQEAMLDAASSNVTRHPGDWSADGKFLLYVENNPNTGSDLWFLPLDPAGKPGAGKPQLYLKTQANEDHAQFSPGLAGPRWVAYASDASGQREVYVESFPRGNGMFQVSQGGGSEPRWSRDGKELFYVSGDSKLMAVDVKTSPKFEYLDPKPLFATRIFFGNSLAFTAYDVTPDGKRFLINTEDPAEEAAPAPITVVLNWQAGLKK